MAKGGKRRNNSGNNAKKQSSQQNNQSTPKKEVATGSGTSVVTVKTPNEILMTEEGKKIHTNSLEDNYWLGKRQEADRYYDEKKKEADDLREKAEEEIKKKVDKRIREIEKEMKDQVEEAKNEAKKIIDDADTKARSILSKLEEREIELDKRGEAYTRDFADLEAQKITYKQEVLASIQSEMKTISDEKEKLKAEIANLKKDLRKKDSDIAALEDDKEFYTKELSNNSLKKSEILSYKLQIENLKNDYNTLNKFYKNLQDQVSKLNAQIIVFGDDPSKAIKENAALLKKVEELQNFLANCPTAEELDKLRETNVKYEELNNKLELLMAKKLELEAENTDLKVSKDEIEACRKFIKILELQKAELQRELDRNIELYNNSTEMVFANLTLIDKEKCNDYPSMLGKITLKTLCERFRGYLANRPSTPLYYEEKTIRTFIAGFASSRLMILEGLSGTGKSSLPRAFADFMGSRTIEVPVQSSWKDRNDLLGFYNDFKKQYKETEFLKALYMATHDPDNIYVIVLDEMNLSRIEYYFADLLSVLEKPNVEDWKIELISDYASITQNKEAWPKLIHEGKLQICDNTWFVGTANKDDSTFIITDKVYDRSVVINFDKRGDKVKIDNSTPIRMKNSDFMALLQNASKFTSTTDSGKYKEMIEYLDTQVKGMFEITFGNRIANQLEVFVPVYVACGGTTEEAIDIMFSRKVLRKLEGNYDQSTKDNLDLLKDDIHSKYKMPITIEAIDRLIDKI